MTRKILLSATAAVALLGAASVANATPLVATGVGIWSADTPGSNINSANQKALPATAALLGAALVAPFGAPSGDTNINFATASSPPTGVIGDFLSHDDGSSTMTVAGCTATCLGTNLSGQQGSFNHVTLMEFRFTIASAGNLTVTHDDGVSLFADGTTTTDLFPAADANPTNSAVSTAHLAAGTYDLWYAADNGNPEQLLTDFVADITTVPEPTSLALLGAGLLGLGVLRRRRRKAA